MKKHFQILSSIILTMITFSLHAQIVNIPDKGFKDYLISLGVDKNKDGKIQKSEALDVSSLDLSNTGFDITGIDDFKNLSYLNCSGTFALNVNFRTLTNLTHLDCAGSWAEDLDVSNLTRLEYLDCAENEIGRLDLSNMTRLRHLNCYNTEVYDLDLSNLVQLEYLNCGLNLLDNLDLSSLEKLEYLDCSIGNLDSLDISSLINLKYLDCSGNNFKGIDIANSPISFLDISNNPLEFLSLKNLNDLKDIKGSYCSNLKYICTDTNLLDSVKSVFSYVPFLIIDTLCTSSSGGTFYTLNGRSQFDINGNGCDDLDSEYSNLKLKITNAVDTGYIISGIDGNFSMSLHSGKYTFEPEIENKKYFSITPTSVTTSLPDSNGLSFCITPKGNFNDLTVSIIPVRAARPGFSDATYKIVYKNQGTTTQSGNVTFNFDDDKMNVISSSPTADESDYGLLSFNFSNLAPFESESVLVTMRTNAPTDNPAVNVNDVLDFSANITAQTDETPEDNTAVLYQTVIGSYDPNDKTCLEGDIITPDMVGKRVNYLIRFENTGTAPAENVVVTDYIDTTVFDVNSLLVTDASHTCHTQISKGNKVQFIFSDIQLPFTEPDKHGYVAFSILLRDDLQIGDSIKNYADIYFDYNLPITTNEALSEVKNRVVTSVQRKISNATLLVYPNPSKGNFSVELKSNKTAPVQISVIDIEGKIVFAKQYAQQQNIIPLQLNQLAQGTYLIRAEIENEIISKKIVIQ